METKVHAVSDKAQTVDEKNHDEKRSTVSYCSCPWSDDLRSADFLGVHIK